MSLLEPQQRRTWIHRALGVVSEVRPGEATSAILMLLNVLLLFVGYYVLKTIREPLILAGGEAEPKSYAGAAQALLLMVFVPVYSWFASRVDRVKLFIGITLFFIVNLELFHLGLRVRGPYVGTVFYIWVGIYILVLIAQFWSFANEIYTQEAGNRLFPLIGVGATAGSQLGARIAGWLFSAGVGVELMLQVPALLLCVCLALTLWVHRRECRRPGRDEAAVAPLAESNGFTLVFRSR
jgi:AAA family ATP:ADP antiporter